MATNGNVNFQEGLTDQTASQQTSNIGKDEVGWYFVEQFYNTLSKSPEKLHVSYTLPRLPAEILTCLSYSTASARSSSTVLRPRLPMCPLDDRYGSLIQPVA